VQLLIDSSAPSLPVVPSAVAVGVFDGVHRGHQQLLQKTCALARQHGLRSVAYTFDPHPVHVLRGPDSLRLLEPPSRRLQRLAELGLDAVWVQPFSRKFAQTSAQTYIHSLLKARLGAQQVVVGAEFTFGSKQSGTAALLQSEGPAAGFAAHIVPLLTDAQGVVSSSRIRQHIDRAEMAEAAACLGRPFMLEGPVVRGAGRGTALGFGTANVQQRNAVCPPHGVYAGEARGPFGTRRAVINVGLAPTFGDQTATRVEVHLLDYSGDPLYGVELEVDFWRLLRTEQKFSCLDDLKAQISKDIGQARLLDGTT
jgi:riboflavin kinase/FMN adenylyltransferase